MTAVTQNNSLNFFPFPVQMWLHDAGSLRVFFIKSHGLANFQLDWALSNVTDGTLPSWGAKDHHADPGPGCDGKGILSPVCPTCDNVLDGAVFALVNGTVVFGLSAPQLSDEFMLLLPFLLSLHLRGGEDV